MTRLAVLGLLPLCACAQPPAPEPAADVPMIEVSTSGFHGSSGTRIYADGTTISDTSSPGQPALHNVQHGSPEAYTKAAAILASEGRVTKAALKPQAQQCLDYGTDLVRASPPVAGFDQAMAACPYPAMSRLMDHVLATLAQK